VAEGTSKGVSGSSLVANKIELRRSCAALLARYRQPVLVERFLPGREFTIGLVGTGRRARTIGVIEVVLRQDNERGAYGYETKEHYENRVEYLLGEDDTATEAAELALAAWRGLGCRDAGRVDVRLDEDGRPSFIEVNPLPGLNPVRSDLPILCRKVGMTYAELIAEIVDGAANRVTETLSAA